MNNQIGLKYGRVRNFWIDDSFKEENTDILHAILDYTNFMAVNGWGITNKKLVDFTQSERTAITETLCKMLDVLFDMGVSIYNEWECKMHESKECFREYLHGFNKKESTGKPIGISVTSCDDDMLPF